MTRDISVIGFIRQLFGFFLTRVHAKQRSSIAAYKSYERKAAHDFHIANGVPLNKNERLTPATLLRFNDCKTREEALETFAKESGQISYINRLIYIWDYYEHIDVPL